MRRFDWLIFLAMIVLAILGKGRDYGGEAPQAETPRRPSPERFEAKPWDAETSAWLEKSAQPVSGPAGGPSFIPAEGIIEVPEKAMPGTGTAFAVDKNGHWLTARHVIDGCTDILIQTGHRRAARVVGAAIHPGADAALLTTRGSPQPFPLAAATARVAEGYHFGFPKGRPGAVHGRLIGGMRLSNQGRYRASEKVMVWGRRSQMPSGLKSIGGMSGGPVFDKGGRVIGIVLAESHRRGRIFTGIPETFRQLLGQAGLSIAAAAPGLLVPPGLTPGGYPVSARAMITSLRIAKVLCRVS